MADEADYGIRTYGDRMAEVYDQYYADCSPAAILALSRLAGNGRALELGVGTGRVALPLREAGVDVTGIDASEAMIRHLRAKPGGSVLPVVTGDFAEVGVEGHFTLIYVVFNTFFNLLTQADQVRCFRNVAVHLSPDGVFVIEAFVPDLGRYRGGQDIRLITQSEEEVRFDVSRVDPVRQIVTATHVTMRAGGPCFYPVKLRYAWPSELDLMAQLAGLTLKERWSCWDQAPFTGTSGGHVSVYGQA